MSHTDQLKGRRPAKSNRAQRLLELANKYGKRIETSRYTDECWEIRGKGRNSLTVYGLPNHGARVYLDVEGNRNWVEVTQQRARQAICSSWF